MRLTLSDAADSEAGPDELLDAARRRGFAGVELSRDLPRVAADMHAGRWTPTEGLRVEGFRTAEAQDAYHPRLKDVSSALGVPVIVPLEELSRHAGAARRLAQEYAEAGGKLVGGSIDPDLLRWVGGHIPEMAVALDVIPGETTPGDVTRAADATGDRLTHVRLFGGGPEAADQDGTGVGGLMCQLARKRFRGALVVTPSHRRYRVAWRSWLGRRGGWGCGGSSVELPVVQLDVDA